MAKKKKDGKKKGGCLKGIITAIFVIIAIIVLLASSLFAITNGIIDFIKDLIGNFLRSIFDFLKNPIKWIQTKWAQLSNWFDREAGTSRTFDENNYEDEGRIDPTMIIQTTTFEEMKTGLDSMISRNAAGLDDIMLKKMLLTYYRGIYLDDTTVLIELTNKDLDMDTEEFKNMFKVWKQTDGLEVAVDVLTGIFTGDPTLGIMSGVMSSDENTEVRVTLKDNALEELNKMEEFYPYEIIGGDTEKGIGEDGKIYLKTTGMVQIYVACDKCNGLEDDGKSVDTYDCETCADNKIKYFKADVLKKMYEQEYKGMLDKCDEKCQSGEKLCYAHDVLKYMKKCYAYGGELAYLDEEGNETTEDDADVYYQRDCITMYSLRMEETEGAQLEYQNESKSVSKADNLWEGIKGWFTDNDEYIIRDIVPYEDQPVDEQNIFYYDKVSQYATPVELMINLLEISASKDFVNSFMETVGNENYIKVKLYTIRNKDIQVITEQWERETTIEAGRTLLIDAYFTQKHCKR